jgi:integrase
LPDRLRPIGAGGQFRRLRESLNNLKMASARPYTSAQPPRQCERSARTLPLTPALAKALKRAKVPQAAERLRLGPHYLGEGKHVVVDDAGRPYHPDTLSDFRRELCGAAEVRQIRLHDARHSCASIMHAQSVPIAVISAWLGRADPAFTMRTYVHAQDGALKAAAATLQKVVTRS